uniref:Oxygenase n=1 Tax=Steinernema glaseri TaxID=37863 RepID=A0A1I8AR96_9BILA
MNGDVTVADLNRSGSVTSTIPCAAPRNSLCAGYSLTVDSRSLPVPWLDVSAKKKRRYSLDAHRSASTVFGFTDDVFAKTLVSFWDVSANAFRRSANPRGDPESVLLHRDLWDAEGQKVTRMFGKERSKVGAGPVPVTDLSLDPYKSTVSAFESIGVVP